MSSFYDHQPSRAYRQMLAEDARIDRAKEMTVEELGALIPNDVLRQTLINGTGRPEAEFAETETGKLMNAFTGEQLHEMLLEVVLINDYDRED